MHAVCLGNIKTTAVHGEKILKKRAPHTYKAIINADFRPRRRSTISVEQIRRRVHLPIQVVSGAPAAKAAAAHKHPSVMY